MHVEPSAEPQVLSCGWLLERLDLGFRWGRRGRSAERGGVQIVITSTDENGPFDVPDEVLAWLTKGVVPNG
jgi:hypothetical protein